MPTKQPKHDRNRKTEKPRLTPEESRHCGRSGLVIFREMGLPALLTYLLAWLRQHYPMDRIVCGFRLFQGRDVVFVPVADTLPTAPKTRRYLSTRSLTPEQMRKILGDDSRPHLFAEENFPDDRRDVIMRREDFIANVRVPLFRIGEATFRMSFISHTKNAFDQEDVTLFQTLTDEFKDELRRALLLDWGKDEPAPRFQDSVALMRSCDGLADLLAEMEQAAPADCTVLLEGETGAGKDVAADALHRLSPRRNGPFVKVNCGAVSESLLESELFGHEKGAFTGATSARKGWFETANGGAIFLDEVEELTPRMQAELLRVLDNREILRVGASRTIPLDIRVIAATNRDLRAMVRRGAFRADLWHRLNVFPLHVPPLRQRRTDIPVLARRFAEEFAARFGLSSLPEIPPEEMERLYRHDWPGNIRELRNAVERAVLRARRSGLCLPLRFDVEDDAPAPPPAPKPPASAAAPPAALPTLAELGDSYVAWILQQTGGRITGKGGAAELLGVNPNTVRNRARRARGA